MRCAHRLAPGALLGGPSRRSRDGRYPCGQPVGGAARSSPILNGLGAGQPVSQSRACRHWLPQFGSLPHGVTAFAPRPAAQEQTALSLTFARPPGDGGSRWLSVVLESDVPAPVPSTDAPAAGTVTFRLRRRQQVRIYHTALPAASPEGFVAAIESSPERPTRWLVTYANSTDRVFPVTGQWRLTGRQGTPSLPGPFPGSWRIREKPRLTVDGGLSFSPGISLSPGTYHLLVVLYPEAEGAQNARAGELVSASGGG